MRWLVIGFVLLKLASIVWAQFTPTQIAYLETYFIGFGEESDSLFTNHAAYSVTYGLITNWNTAYSWGDWRPRMGLVETTNALQDYRLAGIDTNLLALWQALAGSTQTVYVTLTPTISNSFTATIYQTNVVNVSVSGTTTNLIVMLGSLWEVDGLGNVVPKEASDHTTIDPYWHWVTNNRMEVQVP